MSPDAELKDPAGGNKLIVNGNFIPLEEVGNQYKKGDQVQQTAQSIPAGRGRRRKNRKAMSRRKQPKQILTK